MFSHYALLPPLRGRRRREERLGIMQFIQHDFFLTLQCAGGMGGDLVPVPSELTDTESQNIKVGRHLRDVQTGTQGGEVKYLRKEKESHTYVHIKNNIKHVSQQYNASP